MQETNGRDGQARYVLLADLNQTVLEPLMQRLLLAPVFDPERVELALPADRRHERLQPAGFQPDRKSVV